ncbi:hypothetical protein A374_03649 [Fictibacillus macauensis ZFHKF-1]|uniref:Group-specific protein n=1 Tax=Fictibacillus macauensis ZFHKF-1 TaxID=1196324 RepID=I8ALW4_9BACL|nr:hypothetical protein [Fictibacillus macauensis]EIT86634.1 hypothetical protein A374_03649 [Fictibacillus macauensis ZFHKF-1]
MFDPTIYENVKLIVEGLIYEYDYAEKLHVTNRKDLVDLATLRREFVMEVALHGDTTTTKAELVIATTLEDLAGELLDNRTIGIGCTFHMIFHTTVENITTECANIQEALSFIWKNKASISQTVAYTYGAPSGQYDLKVKVMLKEKLHEEESDAFSALLESFFLTYQQIATKGV